LIPLSLSTHSEFIEQAIEVDTAPSDAEAERRSKASGINGLPVLATLSSLSFPESFGHDLMHLIPENVVKNLLSLWTGNFKGLDSSSEDYEQRRRPDGRLTVEYGRLNGIFPCSTTCRSRARRCESNIHAVFELREKPEHVRSRDRRFQSHLIGDPKLTDSG
jgi:hypothetical protein